MRCKVIVREYILNNQMRIEGKFYLNDYSLLSMALEENSDKCQFLYELADVMNPPIFKRQFCKETERSVQYFQSSDVPMVSERSNVFVLRKQAEKIDAIVKENDILVTGFGTIGNVRLVTELQDGTCYANNVARIKAKENVPYGFLYAFMASKYANAQLNKNASGSVVRYIEAPGVKRTLVPIFPQEKQEQIHKLIIDATQKRIEANRLLEEAEKKLYIYTKLPQLTTENYDYFGVRSNNRNVSYFSKSISKIDTTTINAFNHSYRIEKTKELIRETCNTITLEEMLDANKLFSTGSFPRVEVNPPNGIMLINQKDIFNTIIKGKRISKRKVNTDNLLEYGEVLIAGVGTLGENEAFCRTIFANEELEGQLVSGEFIRMKTNEKYLSGYLFAWLSSDYGFRLIRNTQTGTKLCRPIPRLLLQIPVPILDNSQMEEIDKLVKKAHTLYHLSNNNENQAISLVENEIALWQS